MGKYSTRHDQAGEDASEAAHGVAADTSSIIQKGTWIITRRRSKYF